MQPCLSPSDLPPLLDTGATVVASIWGGSVDDYARAAEALADAPDGVVAVEVNVSCPNLEDRGSMFAHSRSATAEVIDASRPANRPMWAKLSPNAAALPELPIVGVGGTSSGADVVEFLLAGASAVEVGTATFADPRAPRRILGEFEQWCTRNGVGSVAELIGGAHG